MDPEQFEYVRSLLLERSGLVVTPEKMYLLETRLFPVARRHGCKTIEDLIKRYREHQSEAIAVDISEAMNTHESLFFRDNAPFELFKKTIVPELLKRRVNKKKIRVWCAACSSGQEPYSLAMILDDLSAELAGWQVDIIATDISHSVLERAAEGAFTQFEVQRGLPVQYLVKHFTQEHETWRLSSRIRERVKFQHFNLLSDPRALGKFDVIFCRNVLIYFDLATKGQVMDRMVNVLAGDGVLFLGSSESTIGITAKFWPVVAGRGVYKHTGGAPCLVENGAP
ncbi:MAG: protein-glutamate O-methyltransferase CheR [Rhodospirillales bacterium]|nr:protein-glutamate O-methyltransferase CheR [Rhodospirillales bacterium]